MGFVIDNNMMDVGDVFDFGWVYDVLYFDVDFDDSLLEGQLQ